MVKTTRTHICPHLGLKSDPTTALHFASLGNYCYHVKPPEVPKEGHQNAYCLVAEHANCPIYLGATVKRMPGKYRAKRSKEPTQKKRKVGAVPIIIGLVLLVLAVFLVPELTGPNGILESVFGGTEGAVTPTVTDIQGAFPTSAGTATPGQGMRPFCQPPPAWKPYIVSQTDTFESLAITYARPVKELVKANCRSDANDLAAGERIYLPELPTPTPTVTPTVTPTNTRVRRTYVRPLPTWTGDYTIVPYPTKTSTTKPSDIPIETPTPIPPTNTPTEVPPTPVGG